MTHDPSTQSALPLVPSPLRQLMAPWGYQPTRTRHADVRRAATQGDVSAQFTLGWMYEHGDDVPQNHREAITWYHRAADLGYPPAQYNLARALYDGDGVPLARADSATWCRRAADQHHATAQYTLGWLYEDGDGVPQDYREAATWYTHAAAQGHPKAQFNLALMLDSGRGVTRNHDEAGRWYSLAAGQGHHAAQGMIDRLAVRYPPGPFEPYEPSSTERVLSELARNRRRFPYSRHAEFLQLEAQARAARRGLWTGR